MGSLNVINILDWSLSDDGNSVLLVNTGEKEIFNKEINYEVIAVNLTNPSEPKELWYRSIKARKLIISADANAYAYSKSSSKNKGYWETTVEFVKGGRTPLKVEEAQFSNAKMSFSPHANFLVYSLFSQQLFEWDLRSSVPKSYQQQYSGSARYECISTVLDDGHIVAKDSRFSRFGVYEPSLGIPRMSKFESGEFVGDYGLYCGSLNIKSNDNTNIYSDGHGRLREISFKNLKKPEFGRLWDLPAEVYPLAIAGSTLFSVTGGNNPKLKLYNLDIVHEELIDWLALDKTHTTIMDAYNSTVKSGSSVAYFDAVSSFEKAGILKAVDAPIKNISPQKASAILNDYGFLAIKRRFSSNLIKHVLKRSIELDPTRSLAYLNLADYLRTQLPEYAANGKDNNVILKEIENNYRMYLSLGGKLTSNIEVFLKGDPVLPTQSNNVCSAIALYANAGRLGELVSGNGKSIPFNGKTIDLVFTTEGTAHVPTYYGYDSATDFPLEESEMPRFKSGTDDAWSGDAFGLLTYRNESHILFYKDMHHPSSTISLKNGLSCSFNIVTTERIGSNVVDNNLCKSLQKKEGPKPYSFDGTSQMDRTAVSVKWGELEINGTHILDITNSGKPVNIAQLEMTSGAGAGCDEVFYEVVNEDASQFVSGQQRDLLMLLQNAMPENRYPILPCGNETSFFSYKNRVYFEAKPANWPPVDAWNQYHRVVTITDNKVHDVCDFKFETTVKSN